MTPPRPRPTGERPPEARRRSVPRAGSPAPRDAAPFAPRPPPARSCAARGRRIALAAALLALAACAASPPPPVLARVEGGEVRAETPEVAERFARLLSDVRPKIAERVPGLSRGEVEVWVGDLRSELELPSWVSGATLSLPRRDHPRRAYVFDQEDGAGTLAHELVHALLDETWDALPQVVEEGLCGAVADAVTHSTVEARRVHSLRSLRAGLVLTLSFAAPRRGELTVQARLPILLPGGKPRERTLAELFALDSQALYRGSPEDAELAYAVGFLVVDELFRRQGVGGLRDLCVRARGEGRKTIPAAWVLAACGAPDEGRASEPLLWAWIDDLALARSDTRRLAGFLEGSRDELAPALAQVARKSLALFGEPEVTFSEWMRDAHPRIEDHEAGTQIELEDVPGLPAAIASCW